MIIKQILQKQIFLSVLFFKFNDKLIVIIISHKNNHFTLYEIKLSFKISSLESYVSSTFPSLREQLK